MGNEREDLLRRLAGRRMSRRELLEIGAKLGLGVAAMSPLLAACGSSGTATPTETAPTTAAEATSTAAETAGKTLTDREKTLVIAYQREGSTIDPAVNWEVEEGTVMFSMYQNPVSALYHEEDDSVEVVPELAESWDISPDNMEITLHLRKGVTFHDGEPYNADAQKFAFDRAFAMNEGPAYMLTNFLDKVEAQDEYTIKLTLKEPMASYMQYLSGFWYPSKAISPKAIKDHATPDDEWAREWMRGNGVGTGPYKLDEWVPNQQWVLSRYENYWGGWEGKQIEKVIHRIIPEASTQRQLLEKGDIDAIVQPLQWEDFRALTGKPGVVTKKVLGIFLTVIQMHHQRPPTSDINVRRALVHAFDYDAALNNVYGELAIRDGTTYPKGWEGYREDIELPVKDLEKAKQYLADAGYAEGELNLTLTHYENDEAFRRIAEMFQNDLASIGVNLTIQPFSTAVMWEKEADPEQASDLALTIWGPDNHDSWGFASILWQTGGGSNWGFYSDPKMDELLDKVKLETDKEKRVAMYEEIDQMVRDGADWIMVCNQVEGYAWRDSLQGVFPSPTREWSIVPYDITRV